MSCSHWWGAETASNEKAGAGVAARAGGSFTVGVGGDFGIAANQPNGTYTALFQVTADYQ